MRSGILFLKEVGECMYSGNGVTTEFPLPKSSTGESIVFSHEGRCAILNPGEGYEIRDGNIVFDEAPPLGANIAVGSKPGALSSKEAVEMIVEGITQMTALLEGARLFVAQASSSVSKSIDEHKASIKAYVDTAQKEQFKEFTDTLARKMREIDAPIAEVRSASQSAVKAAAETTNVCKGLLEAAKKLSDQANGEISKSLDKLAALSSDIKLEVKEYVEDRISAINKCANDTQTEIIKTGSEALADIGSLADDVTRKIDNAQSQLNDIENRIGKLRAGAGRISRKLEG